MLMFEVDGCDGMCCNHTLSSHVLATSRDLARHDFPARMALRSALKQAMTEGASALRDAFLRFGLLRRANYLGFRPDQLNGVLERFSSTRCRMLVQNTTSAVFD